jgi:outer membrane protein OmpA-like peptidoglycan-associated protein
VGWHVDTTYADPAKTSGAAVSPSYPQSVGFAATHNEHGWLRSPSDIKQASLYDYPGFSGAIDYDFETVAKGMDNQSVYGAIHWGFQIRNTTPAVGFAPTAEFAYTMPTQSAEFDVALDRFRAFFTHEPVILYFDTDRDTPSPAELGKLADAMRYLSDFSDTHVEVDGFADERGPGGHNAGLAHRGLADGTRSGCRPHRPRARPRRHRHLRGRPQCRHLDCKPAHQHHLRPQRQHAAGAVRQRGSPHSS